MTWGPEQSPEFIGMLDRELLIASVDDPRFFGEIYRRYRRVVLGLVLRRLGWSEAEDVTVLVFERAFRVRDRFRPDRGVCSAWLYGIALKVISEQTRRRSFAVVEIDEEEMNLPALGADTDAADARVDAQALGPRLREGLEGLDPRDRVVLELVALSGRSVTEVAGILGVPKGTARSRLHRARHQMRERLGDQ